DDLLLGDRALDQPLRVPPRGLAADVAGHEAPVTILVGKAATDQVGARARVPRCQRDHLLVGGPALPGQHGVEVVARGLHVALHEGDPARAVPGELVRVHDRGDLQGESVARVYDVAYVDAHHMSCIAR